MFEQADVRALGKLKRWGDARVLYLMRLVDGAELFVNASRQHLPTRSGCASSPPRSIRRY